MGKQKKVTGEGSLISLIIYPDCEVLYCETCDNAFVSQKQKRNLLVNTARTHALCAAGMIYLISVYNGYTK